MRTLLLLLGALASASGAGDAALRPFIMDWRDNSAALVNASELLEKPAGARGFITVKDGHLVKPGGSRFRIWGFNITANATAPAKEDAPAYADYLARFGINCVRLHFLDRTAPAGVVAANRDDTRALDPERMDRLDFFIAELKKRGIYTDLNLNVGRTYKPGDGVRDHEYIGFGKALTYFDERLIELQREYARQLLTHRNPYTGAEYRHEPAIALVELVNENSIVESWFANRLQGKNTRRNPGTWSDIPESYEKALTAKYHEWLKARGEAPVARLRKPEFAAADAARFRTEASFYMELEDRFFQSMYTFLKKELGVKALVLATSDHNHGMSGYPLVSSAAKLDVVDGHVYWQHPRYLEDAAGKRTGFTIGNTPMVDDPLRSTPVQLSRTAMAGKPYVVSEVNHPFPAEYACEGIPILTAYAALQDWDGLFWYTFEHKDPKDWIPYQAGHFDFRADPVKMTQLAAGAYMFLRGDVRAARRTVTRSYTRQQVIDSLRLTYQDAPYFTPGFPLDLPLRHISRVTSFDGPATGAFEAQGAAPITSDTGELTWYAKPGVVTVETAYTQALIGHNKAQPRTLRNLAAEIENDFSAVTLISLGAPLGSCRTARSCGSMLLSVGSRVANTAMRWNEKRNSLESWGAAPTVIEPVSGTILLRNMQKEIRRIRIVPLDGAGRATGQPSWATRKDGVWRVPVGAVPTPWYLLQPELAPTRDGA